MKCQDTNLPTVSHGEEPLFHPHNHLNSVANVIFKNCIIRMKVHALSSSYPISSTETCMYYYFDRTYILYIMSKILLVLCFRITFLKTFYYLAWRLIL